MLETSLLITGAYLWGSIPTAYLVGRYVAGIDIRQYGSGNVGATNVMTYVGKKTGFLLGAFDCLAKSTGPMLLARFLDQSLGVQVGVGLVAILGHNWSPYIKFTGGRGVATSIGAVLGASMYYEFLVLTIFMAGGKWVFKESGFWTFISIILLPVMAFVFGREPEVIYLTLGIGVLLLGKRLTANWETPAPGIPLIRVLAYRALWDRDVPRKAQWTQRGRISEEGSPDTDAGN
jgi:glycerol-3-phosphate acyltransferase PlsY